MRTNISEKTIELPTTTTQDTSFTFPSDPKTCIEHARQYEVGNKPGFSKDLKRAFALYQHAADQKNPQGQFYVGQCYERGIGVAQDIDEAFRWYQLAAKNGDIRAQAKREGILQATLPVRSQTLKNSSSSSSSSSSSPLPQSSSSRTSTYSARNLISRLSSKSKSRTESIDPLEVIKQEFTELRESAASGNAQDQYHLGLAHRKLLFDLNYPDGESWLKKASAQGHVEASFTLARSEFNSEQFRGDQDKSQPGLQDNPAFRLYRAAKEAKESLTMYEWRDDRSNVNVWKEELFQIYSSAAQDPPLTTECALGLGYCYRNGIGVEKDAKQAATYYELAAKEGNAEAQFELGRCYEEGKGRDMDFKEAFKYYQLAAQQRNPKAYYRLGIWCEQGWNMPKDKRKAVEYYSKAAAWHDLDGVRALYKIYHHGDKELGIEKNEHLAKIQLHTLYQLLPEHMHPSLKTEFADSKRTGKPEKNSRGAGKNSRVSQQLSEFGSFSLNSGSSTSPTVSSSAPPSIPNPKAPETHSTSIPGLRKE